MPRVNMCSDLSIAKNNLESAKIAIDAVLALINPIVEGVTPKYNYTLARFTCPNCSLVLDEGRDDYCPSCGCLMKWDEATTQEGE